MVTTPRPGQALTQNTGLVLRPSDADTAPGPETPESNAALTVAPMAKRLARPAAAQAGYPLGTTSFVTSVTPPPNEASNAFFFKKKKNTITMAIVGVDLGPI